MFFSYYFQSELIFRFTSILFAIAFVNGVFFVEYMRKDRPSLFYASLALSNIIATSIIAFIPNTVEFREFDGYIIPFWSGISLYYTFFMIYQGLVVAIVFFYTIWKRAPKELQKQSKSILYGAFIFSIGTFTVSLFGEVVWIMVVAGIGISILAYKFTRNFHLLYMLPFDVDKLVIIHKVSGLTLFCHSWKENKNEHADILIGGILKALDQITIEVVNKGNIKELL